MPSPPTKKRVLSAIQPSGELHIGNYLGALQQWVALQAGNTCTYAIVDLHAITVPYEPKKLPETVLKTAALLLALGIDPKTSTLFVQSHVSAHAEAAWLLTTITPVGELERMTQYKEKAERQKTVAAGLLAYPVLMAADILLYDTDVVPVGEDQKQHLEFARTLARKFNHQFGATLKEPQAYLVKPVARIMSLANPNRKMSKSDPSASSIALLDTPDAIQKKVRSAVTDSGTAVDPKNLGPALTNLLTIYAALSAKGSDLGGERSDPGDRSKKSNLDGERFDLDVRASAEQYAGKGYAAFKSALADLLVEKLSPIRTKAEKLLADPDSLYKSLARGAEAAAPVAFGTLANMKERMGLVAGER